MNKQEFANKIKGSISTGECIVAPFFDSSTVLIVDRDSYYENMRNDPDIEDFEEYEDAEDYCSEACFLQMAYNSLSEAEKELFDSFESSMRKGRRLAECSITDIAWRTRSDLDRDIELFLEAK